MENASFAVALAAFLLGLSSPTASAGAALKPHRLIAGEIVAQEEWNFFLQAERPGPDRERRTLETLARIKIEQSLARENGLLPDASWEAFLREYRDENLRRGKAKANQAVVYGPIEFTDKAFFGYRHSNMVLRLKEVLAAKGLAPSDKELLRAFDSLKIAGYACDSRCEEDVGFLDMRANLRWRAIDARYRKAVDALVNRAVGAEPPGLRFAP